MLGSPPKFAKPIKEAYLRGRVAQTFDKGSQNTPRWTMTDAHEVRAALDRLRWLESRAYGG